MIVLYAGCLLPRNVSLLSLSKSHPSLPDCVGVILKGWDEQFAAQAEA